MPTITLPKKVGRKAQPIAYHHVLFDDKEYTIGLLHSGRVFVIDREDYEKIAAFSWHVAANSYIACGAYVDNVKRTLYLHNLIMNKLTFEGKGQTETVDHISRNGFDNRKENLRIITQTSQNINQRKKPRVVELPEDCGISPDDIPRHIWYIWANGGHGDRFAIEFKSEGILWKSSSSKIKSLTEKLSEAKNKLQELYEIYPHLNPDNPEKMVVENQLNTSFNAIVAQVVPLELLEENFIQHVIG